MAPCAGIRGRTLARAAIAVTTLALVGGCASPPPLTGGAESPTALARQVLAALADGDRMALDRLALDEAEFRARVWPHLPAARPERNLPFSYVWGDLHQKSDASLSRALTAHRGRAYDLVDVRFDGTQTPYEDFIVHRSAVFVVRGAAGQDDLHVCGSFLEQDGRWKVFSYVVDD